MQRKRERLYVRRYDGNVWKTWSDYPIYRRSPLYWATGVNPSLKFVTSVEVYPPGITFVTSSTQGHMLELELNMNNVSGKASHLSLRMWTSTGQTMFHVLQCYIGHVAIIDLDCLIWFILLVPKDYVVSNKICPMPTIRPKDQLSWLKSKARAQSPRHEA